MNSLRIRGITKLPRRAAVAISAGLAMSSAVAYADVAMSVIAPDKIKWTALDPKAGDKGPMVYVVFGDISKKGPLGRLVKLPPGFAAGNHIHKTDGWVVILKGKHHHFGPGQDQGKPVQAWFQPANGVHDDVCEKDSECILFAYNPGGADFIPTDSKYVEPQGTPKMSITYQGEVKYAAMDPNAGDKGPVAWQFYGDPAKAEATGRLLKLPGGFTPGPHTHSSDSYVMGLGGSMHNFAPGSSDKGPSIGVGGTWFQPANDPHDNLCQSGDACTIFIHNPGGADFIPVK
jgi:hypothetical protein